MRPGLLCVCPSTRPCRVRTVPVPRRLPCSPARPLLASRGPATPGPVRHLAGLAPALCGLPCPASNSPGRAVASCCPRQSGRLPPSLTERPRLHLATTSAVALPHVKTAPSHLRLDLDFHAKSPTGSAARSRAPPRPAASPARALLHRASRTGRPPAPPLRHPRGRAASALRVFSAALHRRW